MYLPAGSLTKSPLIMYDTVTFALLTTILTEWFPGGLTSVFSTRGRVPVSNTAFMMK